MNSMNIKFLFCFISNLLALKFFFIHLNYLEYIKNKKDKKYVLNYFYFFK